jgi:hypothetical protein
MILMMWRDVPSLFILRRLCLDSNPGWLSELLLWRVLLTSYTLRVLAVLAVDVTGHRHSGISEYWIFFKL